jgi:ADP-heptose:LPS heptosyltransferase
MRKILSCLNLGDAVIDAYFCSLSGGEYSLLVAKHLREIIDAIGYSGDVAYLDIDFQQIPPALFNLKNNFKSISVGPIFRDAIQLRKIFSDGQYSKIVANSPSIRWKMLSLGVDVEYLPDSGRNIYERYERLAKAQVFPIISRSSTNEIKQVGIFPDSRQVHKNFPITTLLEIVDNVRLFGFEPFVVLTPGSSIDANLISKTCDTRKVSSLTDLCSLIQMSSVVITADSLPAHVSEYYNVIPFVIYRQVNYKYLPISSMKNGWFGTFDDFSSLADLLRS